ncbi:uncharacterized protein LOC144425288 isoform X2 [Styela clava]
MNNRFKNPTTTVRICGSDRGFMAISRLNADNTSTQGPGRRQSLHCLGAYSNLWNCQANRRRQRKVWSRSWRRTTDHLLRRGKQAVPIQNLEEFHSGWGASRTYWNPLRQIVVDRTGSL